MSEDITPMTTIIHPSKFAMFIQTNAARRIAVAALAATAVAILVIKVKNGDFEDMSVGDLTVVETFTS